MDISKKQFAINSLWKILEQFSAKGISMLVSIVLARILLPNDYGLIALTAVFTNLSDILIDGGFSTALIRKKTIDEYDYNAVFTVSFSMSVVLYGILFFIAPYVAEYYSSSELVAVLRVIGLTFFFQAFNAVRNGIVNRSMQFKLLFLCNTVASLVSGILGIVLAYVGFGVWALVFQRLVQQFILTVLLFIKVQWKFQWNFNFDRIRQMLPFSIGVIGSSFLNFLGGNIYNVVIGKKYSVSDLGYYDKGNQLPMQFSLYTFGAISSVLLPTISASQSDLERVKRIVRKVVAMTSFWLIPLMVGMILVAEEMIILIFTDKWLPSVRMMQYASLYYLATPYMLINVQVFFALGYSRLRVKTEVIRLILMSLGLFIFGFILDYSINTLALVGAVIAVLVSIVTYLEVWKLIHYKMSEVLGDMWKPIVCTILMTLTIIFVQYCLQLENIMISITIKLIIGILVYVVSAIVLKVSELKDILETLFRKNGHE